MWSVHSQLEVDLHRMLLEIFIINIHSSSCKVEVNILEFLLTQNTTHKRNFLFNYAFNTFFIYG